MVRGSASMRNRVLIFGAGGFIGRAISKALAEQGYDVVGATSRTVKTRVPRVQYEVIPEGDMRTLEKALDGCDIVYHTASATTPGSSAGDPLIELNKNLVPTLTLLEVLHRRPSCRLIYLSSGGTLYGDLAPGEVATEATAVLARSYYAAGKAAAEQFIRAWTAQVGASACVVRPSNVYGPGQSERQGFGIVPRAFGAALRREILEIWSDGESVRDYLYIDDLVELCARLASADLPGGTTVVNASSGTETRLADLLLEIERLTGVTISRQRASSRSVDVSRVSIDSSFAHALCGWSAQVQLDDGLERTWAWFTSTQR